MQEMKVWSLGWESPLEKERTTHSSILAWEIPGSEEPGGLQSIASNYKSEKLASHSSSIHSFISSFAYLFSDYLLSIASKARPWGELCSGTHFSYPVLSLFFCLGVYNEGEWVCVDVWLSPFTVHLKPWQHHSSGIPHYNIKSLKKITF